MRDVQYFSKLRGFLHNRRRRKPHGPCIHHSSSFELESLEARVLLSADLAGAVKQAPIIDPAAVTQQAVVQNIQAVQAAPTTTATTPALTLNGSAAPSAIGPGATMTVNVVNPTGNALDWIGIYQVGQSSSTKSVVEHYVNRTDYAMPATTPAGMYEARLFANDSLTLLATSAPITVGTVPVSTPTPTPTPAPTPTPDPTLAPTTSVSASWYVSTVGSNSNDGHTVSTPFRTIGNAVSVARPGDVILVRGGVYQEYITIANSGTSSSPITLASYPGETAILDGSSRTPDPNSPMTNWSGRQPPMLLVAGSHVIVKDLEIRNGADIGVEVDGNNVLLDHLSVHNTYYAGVTFWNTYDCTIQNSTVHDAYNYSNVGYSGGNADGINANGFNTRLTIRNNECYHNSDDGIDVGSSTYVLVEGNNSHHNGFDQGDGEGCKVVDGTNNTFQNNVAHDQRIGFDSGNIGGNSFYNNTAYNNYQADYIEYYGSRSVNTGNSWS